MIMIIQVYNKEELEQLRSFLLTKTSEYNISGPFHELQYPRVQFPLFYAIDDDFKYVGWRDCNNGKWSASAKQIFDKGIPVKALQYPESYPEYFI